jgi:hypothetical protein
MLETGAKLFGALVLVTSEHEAVKKIVQIATASIGLLDRHEFENIKSSTDINYLILFRNKLV